MRRAVDLVGCKGDLHGTHVAHGLRYKPEGRFLGWVAYTLSHSERRDAPGESLHRYDYDQTHILTALGSYKLGRGWQVGARFRYVTGSPYTSEIGGVRTTMRAPMRRSPPRA